MADFEQAIPVLMAHEGTDTDFWVDDPDDLGQETVWGWSMLTIRRLGLTPRDLGLDQDEFTPGCLKDVAKATCEALYRKYFWDEDGYGHINDQTAATKVFDFAVNAGPGHAAVVAQRAANACGASLELDGVLGPKSFAAINACDPKAFVKAFADKQVEYYHRVVTIRPSSAKFLYGWLKRATWPD